MVVVLVMMAVRIRRLTSSAAPENAYLITGKVGAYAMLHEVEALISFAMARTHYPETHGQNNIRGSHSLPPRVSPGTHLSSNPNGKKRQLLELKNRLLRPVFQPGREDS